MLGGGGGGGNQKCFLKNPTNKSTTIKNKQKTKAQQQKNKQTNNTNNLRCLCFMYMLLFRSIIYIKQKMLEIEVWLVLLHVRKDDHNPNNNVII